MTDWVMIIGLTFAQGIIMMVAIGLPLIVTRQSRQSSESGM